MNELQMRIHQLQQDRAEASQVGGMYGGMVHHRKRKPRGGVVHHRKMPRGGTGTSTGATKNLWVLARTIASDKEGRTLSLKNAKDLAIIRREYASMGGKRKNKAGPRIHSGSKSMKGGRRKLAKNKTCTIYDPVHPKYYKKTLKSGKKKCITIKEHKKNLRSRKGAGLLLNSDDYGSGLLLGGCHGCPHCGM